MKPELTQRQDDAYEFIRSYMREHRKPPTLKEIGNELGMRSTNGVFKLLKALEKKGYIEREEHTARGLRLVDTEDAFALDDTTPSLMVVSRTASDQPEQLRQRPTAYFAVEPYFLKDVDAEACCIARAGDDGMNGDGIRKGDYLLIEEMDWRDVRNGEVAACLVGEVMKARRLEHTNGRHHLRAVNRHYTDETFSPNDPGCYIVGRVIGLMRRFDVKKKRRG